METTMELDDFKSAWKTLDARLQRDNALQLHLLRDRKLDKARNRLRPLFWGQIAQILFALPFLLLVVALWSSNPTQVSVIVAGVVLHAYSVFTIIAAGVVLGQLSKENYAAPVLEIQKQLLRVRTYYIRSGMVAGLPWWFLWVVILMVLAGLGGGDLLARAPWMVWGGLGFGAAGLVATAWFHRWSRRPERAALSRRLDDSLGGGSLRRAQAELAELLRFEKDA